jgi:hypothetical protein
LDVAGERLALALGRKLMEKAILTFRLVQARNVRERHPSFESADTLAN